VYHLYSYNIINGYKCGFFWKRSTLKSLYWIEDAESAEPTYEDLDFKEGLTDREYALSSSISQIETVDPSQVF
jgi:hypothetical protein